MNVLVDFNSLFEILSSPVFDFAFNPSIICLSEKNKIAMWRMVQISGTNVLLLQEEQFQ